MKETKTKYKSLVVDARQLTINKLNDIIPGKTYPDYVCVSFKDHSTMLYQLNSFPTGMYCAMHMNGNRTPNMQTGDHDNESFLITLKKELVKSLDEGANIEFGPILTINQNFTTL